MFAKNDTFEKDKEFLVLIQKLLDKFCETNSNFDNTIIDDLNNESIKEFNIIKNSGGQIKVAFSVMTPSIEEFSGSDDLVNYRCTLHINNTGFEYTKETVHKSNRKDDLIYSHILSCKRNANNTIFSKEKIGEYKSTNGILTPYRNIKANNEINIYDNSQQLSREENKIDLKCLPSKLGEIDAKKELNEKKLKMSITNPFALELLERLGYSTKSVISNHSEHKEIWPILENSVVSLLNGESINYSEDWDAYYNEQILYVGDNDYESHKQLDEGAMFFAYGEEERKLAKQYFDGSIPIDQVLELCIPILVNHQNNIESQSKELNKKL